MDYKKAYSEALERANKFYEANTNEGYRQIFEEIFPELKESDERIRREIIADIQKHHPCWQLYKDYTSWIDWLERLGDKAFSVERLFAEAGIKPAYKDGNSWCVLIGENIQEGICGFGETPRDAYVNFLKELWNRAFQTPVRLKPEFEPKFKVGDFVLHGKKNIIFQVEKTFLDNTYRIVPIDADKGKAVTSATEDTLRLWTIQDAKDGDVLATECFIFIFKNIDNSNGVHYYCHCEICKHENDVQFGIALPQSLMGRVGNSISHFSPATKEQRDLLFQKMKEAGYEWDAEKKKLKKIKQKSNIEIGPHSIRSKSYLETSYPVEQNPAWSKEDEEHVNSLLKRLEGLCRKEFATTRFAISEDEDWLKSLKSRVQPHPKSEWSEEDEKMLNKCIEYASNIVPVKAAKESGLFVDFKRIPDEKAQDFLKSVKERYTWKPSDEQMRALKGVASYNKNDTLESLYNDLKKLKG